MLRDVVAVLDGLPQAIELAGENLVTISPAQLARSLEHGLGLFGDGERIEALIADPEQLSASHR